jgi:hypothetical protein
VGAGTITFSLSAGGLDANALTRVFTTTTRAAVIQVAATLSATLVFLPPSVSAGASLLATLTVTNTGQATALGLSPPSLTFSGLGGVSVSGPTPSGPVTVNGAQAVTWTWTLTAGAEGLATGTVTVTGTDVNSGRTATAAAVSSFNIGSGRYSLTALVASPGEVELDRVITLVMSVSNTGRFVLINAGPGPLAITGDGVVLLLTKPQPAAIPGLAPGGSASFTWTFRSIRGGLVYFRDDAVAIGIATPAVTANPVRIVEAGGSLADAIVYPTPFDPSTALMGGLRFRRMPPFTEVRVFTDAGDLVRTLKADDDGLAIWNARNESGSRVVPGVYFWVMKAPQGGLRRGKFEVAR